MHPFRRLALLTCTVLFLISPVMGQVSGTIDLHIASKVPRKISRISAQE